VLPSTEKLDEAEATALETSGIAKDLEKTHKKQADQLKSLGEDLDDWQDNIKRTGAFPHNESARHLVQSSATAAIELLIEHQNHLTNTHRQNLATLGVQVQLLTRESLIPEYSESDVNRLLKDEDENGLTAKRVWKVLFEEMERNQDTWTQEKASLKKETQDIKDELSAKDAEFKKAADDNKDHLKTAENNLRTTQAALQNMAEISRKLLGSRHTIPPQTISSIVLANQKYVEVTLRDQGNILDLPGWSLDVANVHVAAENFEQSTERLRALTILGADVPTCLEELEGMIAQVEQCTHNSLDTILSMIYARWQSNGIVQTVDGVLSIMPITISQSGLQVLLEARLFELLVRGTSVLGIGWIDVQEAIQNFWMIINHSVIEENSILQAYRAWFKSLNNSTLAVSLPQELLYIVTAADPTLSCREMSGSRVLIADILSSDHCLLWKVGEPRASMYAISDLEYYIPSAVTVFPLRRRADGVTSTEPPFTESFSARFVARKMTSLHDNGLPAIFQKS
jgi:hypothetical protein